MPFVRCPPCILLKREMQGVLDYFGVTADEAPTIYLVVLKDQMLKYLLPSYSPRRLHLSHHHVDFALRYKWTGATGDITSADLDAFLAQHEAGTLKVGLPRRPLPSIPSSIVGVKRARAGPHQERARLSRAPGPGRESCHWQLLPVARHRQHQGRARGVLRAVVRPLQEAGASVLEDGAGGRRAIATAAHGCAHSLPRLQELLADGATELVIAKMDSTLNDPPENINVRGYPTIYFFPGNNKQAPVLFEGDRSAKAIKKFLRKNVHNPLPESKKKAEKEAKKGEL